MDTSGDSDLQSFDRDDSECAKDHFDSSVEKNEDGSCDELKLLASDFGMNDSSVYHGLRQDLQESSGLSHIRKRPHAGDHDREGDHSDKTDCSPHGWFPNKVPCDESLQVKSGQWSKEEIDLLKENIASYCLSKGIDNAEDIIFNMSREERKNFYRIVAKGIHRPLFAVYRRVIRMYDKKNYRGKYTDAEVNQLKELCKTMGTDWTAIGQAMGRSASSVKDRVRLLKATVNGKWSQEEEDNLTSAVRHVTGMKEGESVTKGISWNDVAKFVGTRSEKQCRIKWLNHLNWKQCGGREWSRKDDISLIDKVIENGWTEEHEINFDILAEGWISVRSPQWLRGKWTALKKSLPRSETLPFLVYCLVLREAVLQSDCKQPVSGLSTNKFPFPDIITLDGNRDAQSYIVQFVDDTNGVLSPNPSLGVKSSGGGGGGGDGGTGGAGGDQLGGKPVIMRCENRSTKETWDAILSKIEKSGENELETSDVTSPIPISEETVVIEDTMALENSNSSVSSGMVGGEDFMLPSTVIDAI